MPVLVLEAGRTTACGRGGRTVLGESWLLSGWDMERRREPRQWGLRIRRALWEGADVARGRTGGGALAALRTPGAGAGQERQRGRRGGRARGGQREGVRARGAGRCPVVAAGALEQARAQCKRRGSRVESLESRRRRRAQRGQHAAMETRPIRSGAGRGGRRIMYLGRCRGQERGRPAGALGPLHSRSAHSIPIPPCVARLCPALPPASRHRPRGAARWGCVRGRPGRGRAEEQRRRERTARAWVGRRVGAHCAGRAAREAR